MLMGVLQLGQVFSMIFSDMIISAFITSVAYNVLPFLIKDMLGITVPHYFGAFKGFYTYRDVCLALPSANPTVMVVSVTCMTLLVVNSEIVKPRLKKTCLVPIPMELLVMVLGTVASHFLSLEENQNVSVIGHVPRGFPVPSVPLLELMPRLLVDSFILAMVGYASVISMAKVIAKRKGYVIQATQELYALGIINFVGSFFSCPPVSVSLSRSVIQEEVGGVTMLTSFFSSTVLIVMLYSLGPLFSALPNCVMSAVILVSFKRLYLQVNDLAKLWSYSRLDAAIWLTTFVVSVVVDMDYGLLAGVVASALVLLLRAQQPPALHLGHVPFTDLYLDLDRYHKTVEVPGVKIFQFGGPLHFGNISYFHSSLFSVTGLHLADVKSSSIPKESVIAAHPSWWCIGHAYAGRDYASLYDLKRGAIHELDASTPNTSHGDVSQDNTSRIDVSQDNTSSIDVSQDNTSSIDVSQDNMSSIDVSQEDLCYSNCSQDDMNGIYVSQEHKSHDDVSQGDESGIDVSQDDKIHSDAKNDDANSNDCNHGDANQHNTSEGGECQVSMEDTPSDSAFTHKSTDKTLVIIDDKATTGSTCITLPVPCWLVLDLSLVSFMDSTGAHLLTQLHRDLQTTNVTLCLASASDRVMDTLERCDVQKEISRNFIFHSIHDAVTTITCPGHRQSSEVLPGP